MKEKVKYAAAVTGTLLLISLEISRIYYIMPFPGSQRSESIELAYWLHQNAGYIRLLLLVLLTYPVFRVFKSGSLSAKVTGGICLALYLMVFYQVNYRMSADKMFLQPTSVGLASADSSKIDRSKLVLGVVVNGVARAYPIELIGYHHQVRDTLGGEPIMVTYCTVCRTGRVYKPRINGELENFRLVGMDHFNAMFEDSRTGSWWRQVSGEAVAGPLTGSILEEIPSQQVSLLAWIDQYPGTLILQPDKRFSDAYQELEEYDEGTILSGLERRDSLSWKEKSWVVGVQNGTVAKAYDWNDLLALRVINDTVGDLPVVITLEPDSVSFHAWQRDSLVFELRNDQVYDKNTSSRWNWRGQCVEGPLAGSKLRFTQAYQEFWHSWKTFRPHTATFSIPEK
ncbi:MAG: DUF3179 domain-containing (seleno)protein [Cyclobacteriaceae bacterium]|jgi:hypothetical protein